MGFWLVLALAAGQAAVLDDLEARARAALARIPRAYTREAAEAARPKLRARLEESLGFRRLPWPPELRPSVKGVLLREGFRIEKVVFQSLPGTWIPAHLYLPEGISAPAPAVLFYNGHWWPDSKTRPDFQAFCVNMARMGFVVLTFDAFGQGERGVSDRDHRRTEALLAGISQQGIAEYETRCALEYLLSRAEVDRARIGMTGASGGGFNTWITTALDERIAAAVPVVGTSEFYEQTHVTRPLDWYKALEHCHYIPGLFQYANNHELLAMAAPRPVLIVAASVDQSFPLAGVRAVHAYGADLYRAFGAGEKVGLFVDHKESHGYQKAKREAAYGWFLRWLMHKGDGSPAPEPETVVPAFDVAELQCFDGGKQPAGPGIMEAVRQLAARARETVPIEALMGAPPEAAQLTIGLRVARTQRVVLRTQPGIDVPALVLRPGPEGAQPEAGILVAVDDRGKEALGSDPLVLEALRRGWMVWAIDPRGIGELALEKPGWVFAVSLMLGENFVWRQAWDIYRIAEFAATATPSHRSALYASGHNAVLATTYVLAMQEGSQPEWAVLRGGFTSFRQFIERPRSQAASFRLFERTNPGGYDREIPPEYFVFRGLEGPDLPQILARAKARSVVVEPINGDWETEKKGGFEEFLRAEW